MFDTVTKVAGQVGGSALATVGIRAVEEPRYIRRALSGAVEIRRYGPRIAAQTTVAGDKQKALNTGFRRLASYIFGANHRRAEIAMTAPVGQHSAGDEIAMTAPVAQTGDDEQGWTVRFFMPSSWSMTTLPTPDDDTVQLVAVPAETVAVLRFTGDRGPNAVAERTAELLDILHDNGIQATGEPMAWFYDPPWTLPFARRNEVVVAI
ncbi:SOUL family heme-binding protein [Mycolicibacterium xanthum]|uniref:SOUL family heme-binding protein n=1 Tax=Mycolicibacterium xanthum TaxID=2796469 RepID=UPI0027DF5F07|nr:heme-binding protein [Mycolicibacterium xanthum]